MKTIHFHIYEPDRPSLFGKSKNDKSQVFLVYCENSEQCDLYKRGECVYRMTFGGCRCPFGKRNSYAGFTSRARKYREWNNQQKEKYKDVGSLSSPETKMAYIGEYVYLPYHQMNLKSNLGFLEEGHYFNSGSPFMLKKIFNVDKIRAILNHRPHAMMGGEITSYQTEQVPKFVQHLKEVDEKLFNEAYNEIDKFKEIYDECTNIGRNAVLETLNPNVGTLIDIHKGEWIWDGEFLTSMNSKASFMLVDNFSELRLKPNPRQIVKITNEEQVNQDTEFVD